MKFNRSALALAGVLLLSAGLMRTSAFAAGGGDATSSPEEESQNKIRASEVSSPLGSNFAGEEVSLYDGSTTFSATDVDLPGNNGLPVRIGRRFKVEERRQQAYLPGFGDWDIDLPRIHGVFLSPNGWKLQGTAPYARCSSTALPDTTTTVPSAATPAPTDVWQGTYLYLPGQGEQELLINDQPRIPAVSDGRSYPWITNNFYRLRCLPQTANGLAGEAFVALGPDGTQYTFDRAVTRAAQSIKVPSTTSAGKFVDLGRQTVSLLISRMQDRFGNWVAYDYSGEQLTGIRSSDGRSLSVAWSGDHIQTITSYLGTPGARQWTYAYTTLPATAYYGYTVSLNRVTQPDNSAWTYSAVGDLRPQREAPLDGGQNTSCPTETDAKNDFAGYHLTIGHPSGASVLFDFDYARQHRSHTPIKGCQLPIGTPAPNPYVAGYWDGYVLTTKTVSGPGIAVVAPSTTGQVTTYAIGGGASQLYTTGTATDPCPSCPSTKTTTVTNPDGTYERYLFGIMYGLNEGQQLQVERGQGTAASLSTSTTQYITNADLPSQPFPDQVGTSRNRVYTFANRLRPAKQSAIVQDGVTFTNTPTFDNFARTLTATKRSAPLGFSKTESTVYYDDFTHWVLGLVKSSITNSIETASTVYWPGSALPHYKYRFGQLQQSLVYNADGTLASITDALNNKTSLSNWKRGIPQTATFPVTDEAPAGAIRSAVVDDNGWVRSTTDENGYTTGYGYDAMGRMASIAYPSGDSTVWNATTQVLQPLTANENGFPAGYWRQLTVRGNAVKAVYFDALQRPLVTITYDSTNPAATLSQTVVRYDAGGHEAFRSFPTRQNVNYASITKGIRTFYDAIGRTLQIDQDSELGVLSTKTQYLTNFKTLTTNPRLKQTRMGYVAYDQPSYDLPYGITSPEDEQTEIYRDSLDRPVMLRRRNTGASVDMRRYYVYDATTQRLCKTIEPETGSTVIGYDAVGNTIWSASGLSLPDTAHCDTDAAYASGRRVDRTYDARNRIKTLSFPDGVGNQQWTYTPDSLPSEITTWNGGTSPTAINAYHYNKRRMLDGQGDSVSQTGWYNWSAGYGYDGNGNIAVQTYPTGLVVDYAPNALGQPTRAGSFATGVTYYPNGAIAQFTYGNGLVHTMQQNTRQLPMRSRDALGAYVVLDDNYTYDYNGNVAAISDGLTGGRGNRTMNYDGLDRLTDATSPMFGTGGASGTAVYTYDVLDNLKTVKAPGRDQTYYYDPTNRLTNVINNLPPGGSVIGLGYDLQGNVSNKNAQATIFDYGNRLRQVNYAGSAVEVYRYDGLGRRILAWSPVGGNILSQYSQSGKLLFQWNTRPDAYKATEYIYLAGSLVATHDRDLSGNVYITKYQHTDSLGSPVAVTDDTRQITERSEYEPYGFLTNRPLHDGPGYAGHVGDAATGLSYMQQRYYDPGIGRFLSVDPVTADSSNGGNFNRYWYANGNPYKFKDPDGRQNAQFVQDMIYQGYPASMGQVQQQVQSNAAAAARDAANESAACKLDDLSAAGAAMELTVPPVDVAGAILNEAAGSTALLISPTPERALSVATGGLTKVAKVAAEGASKAVKVAAAVADTTSSANEAVTGVERHVGGESDTSSAAANSSASGPQPKSQIQEAKEQDQDE